MTGATVLCRCGTYYTDDAAGRHTHRQIHGHTPTRPRPAQPEALLAYLRGRP